MTKEEKAEAVLGIRSMVAPYGPGELGKSQARTYSGLITWLDGPLMGAVEKIEERLGHIEGLIKALPYEHTDAEGNALFPPFPDKMSAKMSGKRKGAKARKR